MSGFEFLASLCVARADSNFVVKTVAMSTTKTAASKKNGTSPELSTLVILRRLASPCRTIGNIYLLKNPPSHMREKLWGRPQRFMNARVNVLCDSLHAGFVASRARKYTEVVSRKRNVLENCIEFFGWHRNWD